MSEQVFRGLSGLTRVVASSHRLDRALSAADVPAVAKRALLDDLTKHALEPAALNAAVEAITSRSLSRTEHSQAAEALARAAVDAAFESADPLPVESSLHAISALIDHNGELRQALSDFAVDDDAKSALLAELLNGKADPVAIELVCTFIFLDHGRRVVRRAREAAKLAAKRRNALMVDVTTAIELDEGGRNAITAALETNYRRSVEARFAVDPAVIGSVVVSVNDEVLDGSVRHRLDQARKALIS